jgi:hypothetical protein
MADYTAKPRLTVLAGMTGSGKTTLAFEYLKKSPVACRFIFDDQGQASARLKLPLAGTVREMERALSTRWVCFNPHILFPGDLDAAFRFFCDWCFQTSKRGPGWKQVLVDEIWRFQDRDKIPKELAVIAQMGRVERLELIAPTQVPHLVNSSILGSSTELICFRLDESVELRKVGLLGAPVEKVSALPLGSFISINRLTRGLTLGKVF